MSDVSLELATAMIEVGKTTQLTVTVEPSDATDKTVKWTSDDTSVATVDANGKVTAVKAGTTKIRATATNGTTDTTDDKSTTCEVTVTEAAKPEPTPGPTPTPQTVTRTVTFRVANGSWDDGKSEDVVVKLTGSEGDTLKLAAGQIPAVGSKPADGYKEGSWDVMPSVDAAIEADTTYTYTYAKDEAPAPTPATPGSSSSSSSGSKESRVAGGDRYATMSALVPKAFTRSRSAVVASGASFADALAAAALAGAKGCPVVLTDPAELSDEASGVVSRLGATDLTIVGGPAAVSDAVAGSLGASRVEGEDRYATAVATMAAVRAIDRSSDTVVVATGSGFADALSIGPWAWSSKSPILLALPDGTLRQDAVDAIRADGGIRRVVLVGGPSVVSDQIKAQLGDAFQYDRLGGADRYETSAAIAGFSAANGLGWSRPVVATGASYADALSAAAVCGKNRSVLLLADSADDPTIALLRENGSKVSHAYVAGGTGAVSDSVESAVRSAVR